MPQRTDYMHYEDERNLMREISDALGIEHFDTSTGSTVRNDFLVDVIEAMGAEVPAGNSKDDNIKLAWEVARGQKMPSDRLSVGGTVTNLVLSEILEGIKKNHCRP